MMVLAYPRLSSRILLDAQWHLRFDTSRPL
jgi:hypothetical protein